MVIPRFNLFVDWDDDTLYTGAGEDVTARLRAPLTWSTGRDYASQLNGKAIAGVLVAFLDNDSGDYSSFNTSSPLTGKLKTGRRVQLQGGSHGFPYTFPIVFAGGARWTGRLEKLTPLPNVHGHNLVRLEAWGPLAFINQEDIELAMSADILTGTAVANVLDEVGWPFGDRDIDVGQTTMSRFWVNERKALGALRDIEVTEAGFLRESKGGDVVFEDRHRRLKSPYRTSQAAFSDALGATLGYGGQPRQKDPAETVFNKFSVDIQTYTVGALAVLWTLAESGANSPQLAPGETRNFWANYPNPDSPMDAFVVDAWSDLVDNTDYEANTQSGGGGTDTSADLAVAETKFGNRMKIAVTNNGALSCFLTLLQAQGTPVSRNDPIRLSYEDTVSRDEHGERSFDNPPDFIPTSTEGEDWCRFHVSMYKDENPILEAITIDGNRDHAHMVQALTRDISDRITIVANDGAGLGINGDFFIEHLAWVLREGNRFACTMQLSPAAGYSDFWVLDESVLDTSTIPAY